MTFDRDVWRRTMIDASEFDSVEALCRHLDALLLLVVEQTPTIHDASSSSTTIASSSGSSYPVLFTDSYKVVKRLGQVYWCDCYLSLGVPAKLRIKACLRDD
jgi:hypothetical protein